jgi:hypothetical protein
VIVSRIQDSLRAAKSCQDCYTNKRCRSLEFEVGSHVYLKVSLMNGVKRFGVKGKLAPRYIRPFPILEKCGMTQAGIATVIGRSSRYLSRIAAKEVLKSTHECCIT